MSHPQSATRVPRSEMGWVALAAMSVVLLSSLPYGVAALTTPDDLRFGGALVTPLDAQSYLAKMRQGYDGAWLFRLPFTAQDEPDAFLYTFYLALGHLARLCGWSLVVVYHLARILGGWILLVTVYRLIARVFDDVRDRRRVWLFVALTSGLGWIGLASTDTTIPESNTFFSIFTNAHFPWSIALMLIIFMTVIDAAPVRAALASIGLAILQPFAPIAIFVGLFVSWSVGWMIGRRGASLLRQVRTAVIAGLSIAPLMIYFYLAAQRDPILQGWYAQNVTPSPPPIEFLIGYGLMWVLAVPGARVAFKRGRAVDVLLVAWMVSSAALLYAPFALQRRFSLGLHIPIVLLAMMGLESLVSATRIAAYARRLVLILSIPTTLLLLMIMSTAAISPPDGRLFFSANEAAAFDWLRVNVPHDSVVLAAPETGLFLPAWADVRVIYGHPFETLDASNMKTRVEEFFAGAIDRTGLLKELGIGYVFFGPRERKLGEPDAAWQAVFAAGDVIVYRAP